MKMPWILYGTAWKKDQTTACVERALHAGFRGIDTANQAKHYSEALVGEGIAKVGLKRDELFLQTKFTSRDGQDDRLPYDPAADLTTQVQQSFQSSLEHLKTEYIDSYVLHGPYNYPGLGQEDAEVWASMEAIHATGAAKALGISNVNIMQLEMLYANAKVKPSVVQNRCYAVKGWDRPVRTFCKEHKILYQGFSLLTANPFVMEHPFVEAIAKRWGATEEQVVFRFAQQVGMNPLTGTTSPEHMKQDLEVGKWELTETEVSSIEHLVG